MTDMFESIGDAMSRSGSSSPTGKLVVRIDVPVSEELGEAITTLAMMHGIPRAEWVRKLIEKNVFGELTMVRRMAQVGPSANGMSI